MNGPIVMDQYGWRAATEDEVHELAKEMDLVRMFHSVADTSLWYIRQEYSVCTNSLGLKAYARREELNNADKPGAGYQINQKNLDDWRSNTHQIGA